MNESQLKAAVTKRLRAMAPDVWMFKVHGGAYQQPGIPDIIGCARGRMFAIELKHPDGKNQMSKVQEHVAHTMTAAGCAVGVARSIDEALAVVALAADGQVSFI